MVASARSDIRRLDRVPPSLQLTLLLESPSVPPPPAARFDLEYEAEFARKGIGEFQAKIAKYRGERGLEGLGSDIQIISEVKEHMRLSGEKDPEAALADVIESKRGLLL